MVTVATFLTPPGVVTRSLAVSVGKALLAGACMAGVAYLLRGITPFVAAPLALLSYFVSLWALRGIEPEQVAALRQFLDRKLKRA